MRTGVPVPARQPTDCPGLQLALARSTSGARLVVVLSVFAISLSVSSSGEPPFRISPRGQVSVSDLMRATRKPASRDRVSDDELAAIRSEHEIRYGRGFTPTLKPEERPKGDYYANSVILSDGQFHTVLPPSSLIRVPDAFADRVLKQPSGALLLWPDFLRRNRRWILPIEVNLSIAKGEDPIPEKQRKQIETGKMLVVGVFHSHPISVLGARQVSSDGAGDDQPPDRQP